MHSLWEFQRAQGPDRDSTSHFCLSFPCCTQGSDKAPHSGHWLWHWIEINSANVHSPLTFLPVFPRGETISFQRLSLITPGDIYSYCFVWCKNIKYVSNMIQVQTEILSYLLSSCHLQSSLTSLFNLKLNTLKII